MIVYKISKVGNTPSIFADNQIHKIYIKYVDELKNETPDPSFDPKLKVFWHKEGRFESKYVFTFENLEQITCWFPYDALNLLLNYSKVSEKIVLRTYKVHARYVKKGTNQVVFDNTKTELISELLFHENPDVLCLQC